MFSGGIERDKWHEISERLMLSSYRNQSIDSQCDSNISLEWVKAAANNNLYVFFYCRSSQL